MTATLAFIAVGALFIVMALTGSVLKRLPLTTSLVYLLFGLAIGPAGLRLVRLDPLEQSALLEHLTEVAVIVSLFTAGLKLRTSMDDQRWRLPVLLASVSMVLTITLITAVGVFLLGLPLGAAVLLGAVLAPTDPVLASDVQVENASDQDRLRFALTGEAGLNDGTAFPFVMLGLGLLGLHERVRNPWDWVVVDLIWAVGAGLGIGASLAFLVGKLVLHLRRAHKEAVGLDDFLALGLIGLSYGAALLVHAYGFLAVFAAGLALRRVERQQSGSDAPEDVVAAGGSSDALEIATDPERAPAYMTQAVLTFNEQLERIGEVTVVVLVGSLLSTRLATVEALWFVPLLLFGIRPLAVFIGLAGSRTTRLQRRLIGWFGIRGIGSLYYLMYAVQRGVPGPLAERLVTLTLATIAVSVVVHGISVTPLMNRYAKLRETEQGSPDPDPRRGGRPEAPRTRGRSRS